jgi:HSP90 family molecular chaperone
MAEAIQVSDPVLQALVTQVQLSNSTLELAINKVNEQNNSALQLVTTAATRFDDLSNQYLDRIAELGSMLEQLQTLKENFLVALEALHKTIDESDRNLDDQAKITQRIGQMELTYERALAQANQPNQ